MNVNDVFSSAFCVFLIISCFEVTEQITAFYRGWKHAHDVSYLTKCYTCYNRSFLKKKLWAHPRKVFAKFMQISFFVGNVDCWDIFCTLGNIITTPFANSISYSSWFGCWWKIFPYFLRFSLMDIKVQSLGVKKHLMQSIEKQILFLPQVLEARHA